jgi:3-hydroxy acid dehydrogenase/malonic semialdehyde reductase
MTRHGLVVGASSGIGAAVTEDLVRAGWQVTAAARRLDALTDLATRLGSACTPAALDVTDPTAVDALAQQLRETGLNALVNCAGHDHGGRVPFHEARIADAISVLETNAIGLLRVTRATLPLLATAEPADIVNVGSVNGVRAVAGLAAYSASKFAVHGFTAALRDECAALGIRVTEVLPGMTRTGFAAARWPGDEARVTAYYDDQPALLAPRDIARAVRFALDQPPGVCCSEITIVPVARRPDDI